MFENNAAVKHSHTISQAFVFLLLGEDAAAAAIYCNAGTFTADETYFTESGEFIVRFPANGEVEWGVIFLDAEGKGIYNVDFMTKVMDPASIVEEALADAAKAE